MIAGPSEILVLADGTCRPAWVAADLLSQAEHDRLATAVLVCDSEALAGAVSAELERQIPLLPRADIARASIDNNGKIIIARDMAEGVDIDPMCVRTAGENAQRNGVADKFTVLVGDLSDQASGEYNIITANIVAAAILSLAPHVPVLMAPGARFIASGIIDERRDEVLTGLKAAGLTPIEVKEKRGWVCIICKKSDEKEA